MSTLEFFTNPMSRGRIVRWMLEEVGEPYETHILQYHEEMKSDAYRAINPMGKVPAIRHNGAVVTECAAICAYLADVFPQAGLAPDPKDRAAYYRWLFFAAGPVEMAVTARALDLEAKPDQTATVGYGTFDDVMDTLEIAVGGKDYLVGDRFSAADVYLGSQIGWGLQFGTVEKRPAFEAYWQRISDRDACHRAKKIDDSLIPKPD